MRLGENLAVLRRREFRLLFLGQGVSVLGDRMVAVALAFAVIELGGSASEVGPRARRRVGAARRQVLVGGVVADRTSRRAVMVTADLVRIASQGAMAALVITGVGRDLDARRARRRHGRGHGLLRPRRHRAAPGGGPGG